FSGLEINCSKTCRSVFSDDQVIAGNDQRVDVGKNLFEMMRFFQHQRTVEEACVRMKISAGRTSRRIMALRLPRHWQASQSHQYRQKSCHSIGHSSLIPSCFSVVDAEPLYFTTPHNSSLVEMPNFHSGRILKKLIG